MKKKKLIIISVIFFTMAFLFLQINRYMLNKDNKGSVLENTNNSQENINKQDNEENHNKEDSGKKENNSSQINADKNFPMAYTAAQKAYASADDAYKTEDYTTAAAYAKQVLEALADIKEITPLPQYYIVRPWEETKDCYWNISGRSYVYNNPLLWENLYQANKSNMPKPSDPNLIMPGMKMEIPSLTGEYREGVYSPSKKYDGYSAVNAKK